MFAWATSKPQAVDIQHVPQQIMVYITDIPYMVWLPLRGYEVYKYPVM